MKRINAQISLETKKKSADYVINNSKNRNNVKKQVFSVWKEVTNKFLRQAIDKN